MFRSFVFAKIWSLILLQLGLICLQKTTCLSVLEAAGSVSSYLFYGLVELAGALAFWRNEGSNRASLLLDIFVDSFENTPVNSKCLRFRGTNVDKE